METAVVPSINLTNREQAIVEFEKYNNTLVFDKFRTAISDKKKFSDDHLIIFAGKLRSTIKVLTNVFLHSGVTSDAQVQRLLPSLAEALKVVDSKIGGTGDTLKEALEIKGGPTIELLTGGNGDAVNAALQQVALAQQGLALQAQQANVDMAKLQVEAFKPMVEVQAKRASLVKQILDRVKPADATALKIEAMVYAALVEGLMLGLLYFVGKGAGGAVLIASLVVIQMVTSVSQIQISKVLSGLGGAVGAGAFSIITGLGGAVGNAISNLFGLGNVVADTPFVPVEAQPVGEGMVIEPGRGFTPAVKIPMPQDFPDQGVLDNIEQWVGRIDFFMGRLMGIVFGDVNPVMKNIVLFCAASVIFYVLFYLIRYLLEVLDELRIRRAVNLANSIQFQQQAAPPALAGAVGGIIPQNAQIFQQAAQLPMLGNQPAAATAPAAPVGLLANQGGKKRRSYRNRKNKKPKTARNPTFFY